MIRRRIPGVVRTAAALAMAGLLVGACMGRIGPGPSATLPEPTCGGIKIKIDGALPCERVVEIAIAALRDRAPNQLARGVAAIDVFLAACPRNEVPSQIDCGGEPFAQLVKVTFSTAPPNGPIEPSLTVAVAPVTGRVLGIANPLIR